VNFIFELNKELTSNVTFAFVLIQLRFNLTVSDNVSRGQKLFLTWKDCGGSLPLVGSFSAALPLVGSLKV
jgi:hypothetical protein